MNFTWIIFAIVALYLFNSVKILMEYERGVIFRLGRLLPVAKGPGMILVFAPIDRIERISLRVETMDVPPQDVVTRDNITVKVSAVVFFRVVEPLKAVVEVEQFVYATSQLAQTRLRAILGEADLDELLGEREKLNARLQETLDEQTEQWGIKVQAVEVKHVDLPEQMIRAIARQAEAERERRAKIIHADGELQASQKLTEAAKMLATEPSSITLRYLQTLTEIGAEKNTTVVFPLPIDLIQGLSAWAQSATKNITEKTDRA
jgi:regulator of protease activity HflC (stomatin/prohibitin superfamily)